MRNPNGYGSITKLKGNRRRPWCVRITTGKVVNFETQKAYAKQTVLGYYATRREAMQALAAYNDDPYNLDRQTVTIDDIWQRIQDHVDVSDDRRKVYKSNYKKYVSVIGDRKVKDVHADLLQQIIDSIPFGYSTQSITRSVLNQIFNHAIKSGIITKNYMEYVKLEPQETKIKRDLYTPDEIADLWDHADLPEYALTLILLYQGMRIKELREMEKAAVDLGNNTIKVVEGKNKQSCRIIPIHNRIRPLIIQAMESDSNRLFDFSKTHYDYFVSQVLNHKPYDTRHTFASKMNKIGTPKLIIQRIMGHKPDSVLEQSYIHLTMDELAESINRLCY